MFVAQRGLDANTQGVEFLAALVGGLLNWLGDLLGPLGEGLVHRQAGRALAAGRVGCSLKVISGRQQGLSSRWRSGAAAVSPGRLDFTWEGRPLRARPFTISYVAVLGPARPPRVDELRRLPGDCRITELQTPTATLGWAVPVRDLPGALEQLQNQPADG